MKIYHIIPGRLYQSAYTHQLGDEQLSALLKEHSITLVVNLWSRPDPRVERAGVSYLHVPLPDGLTRGVVIEKAMALAVRISSSIDEGGRVLVHCRGGRNRSSFVSGLTLYLRGMAGLQAAAVVLKARPRAFSNQHFLKYLESL